MGSFIDTLKEQAGGLLGGAINTGLGLLFENHEDKRQVNQQQKLTNIQIAANKQLSDYNAQQQLKMWHDTNYGAQMEELRKAGLNPGLIYGLSGGGATTTGGGAQSAGGGTAAGQSGEILGLQQLGIQNRLTEAQTKALESQANLNNVEAKKKSGVDTQLGYTTIEQIKASTQNIEAQTTLTNIETQIKEIEKESQSEILDKGWNFKILEATADKINHEIIQIANNNWTFNQTKEDVIKTIKQQAINAVLEGILTKAKTNLTKQQISNLANEISLSWDDKNPHTNQINTYRELQKSGIKLMDKQTEYILYNALIQGVGTIMNGIGKAKGSTNTIVNLPK